MGKDRWEQRAIGRPQVEKSKDCKRKKMYVVCHKMGNLRGEIRTKRRGEKAESSGRDAWGQPSAVPCLVTEQPGVALNIREVFGSNFSRDSRDNFTLQGFYLLPVLTI
jgi:hypothetical protein